MFDIVGENICFGVSVMKVDGTSLSPVGNVQAINRLNKVGKRTTTLGRDEIAVSDNAQVYQSLLQKAKEIPSIREERVQSLTEQINNGEFQVDGQKIAEKLLSPDF